MKYLLDSHTFLWTLQSPGKLSAEARRIVNDPLSELVISIATPWELAIKTKNGKLDARVILSRFDELIASGSFTLLETRAAHAIRAGELALHHRDPFDRLMAAQAIEMGLAMLSKDEVFDLYGVLRIWS